MADRPRAGEVETRSAPELTPTVEGKRLRGLVPYGVESRDLGGWREVIEPGALSEARLDDLIATVDHAGIPLGRFPGTLDIEDRDDGLHWSLEPPESRADVREAVERGDLRSCSWRMIVAKGGDRWEGRVRHVEAIEELRDVAVVTAPAYEARAELRERPEPDPEPDPEPEPKREEEAAVADKKTGGGLRVESRSGASGDRPVEERVLDAMAAVPKGEQRSLTELTGAGADGPAMPVTPPELSTYLWDRLRDAAVVLQSGVRVIPTDRRSIKWPRLVGDMTADFYDELEEITPSDIDLDDHEATPKAIKALARGSSEAFEDSDPDLLRLLQGHLQTVLSLKLDRELLVGNSAKGFPGLVNYPGVTELDAGGTMDNYDALLRAVGIIAGKHVPGPYVAVAHPWTATALSLLKKETGSNEPLERPEGAPDMFLSSQVGAAAGSSTIVVYSASQVAVVRRRDTTVEVDRSQEFTSDAVLVRGKVRATLFLPYTEAVVKITDVPAPDPAVTTP